eukprot:4637001-Prymnesium_polylepis.1
MARGARAISALAARPPPAHPHGVHCKSGGAATASCKRAPSTKALGKAPGRSTTTTTYIYEPRFTLDRGARLLRGLRFAACMLHCLIWSAEVKPTLAEQEIEQPTLPNHPFSPCGVQQSLGSPWPAQPRPFPRRVHSTALAWIRRRLSR